jgi:uncharacterized protein Yka (UPF0111/DUF47 family)
MAKRSGGRPKKGEKRRPSRPIRVPDDLADKMEDIAEVMAKGDEPPSTAKTFDTLFRAQVEAEHQRLLPKLVRLRRLNEQKRKILNEPDPE